MDGKSHLHCGVSFAAFGRVDDGDFLDVGKMVECFRERHLNASAVKLSFEQAAHHESEHAKEDVDLNFLICPMKLGSVQ